MSSETPLESRGPIVSEPPAADPEYSLIDIGQFIRLLWRRRSLLLLCPVAGAALAYALAYLLHPAFDATVRLMPPDHKESLVASLSGQRNEGDLYLGLISSRTVADDVIESQHLKEYFHTDSPTTLRNALAGMAKFSVDRDQFVTVVVRAREPQTAMNIANEFPRALYRLNHAVALSQASHRFEYFEGPLEQEKNKLAAAEDDLKLAQQKTGMVMPEAQVQMGLSAIASLKQQITSRREQLAALETGSTRQNPQVIQLNSEIASLSGELGRLQAQTGGSGLSPSTAKTPELALEIERKAREVRFHETLFEVLSKQYENARVDDSYSPPIELVDAAVLPDRKSWPSRRNFALYGFLGGFFFGLLFILVRAFRPFNRMKSFLSAETPAHESHG